MPKKTIINTRIDARLKSRVEKIFAVLGLNHSTAINLFYKQIVLHGGLPFSVLIPESMTTAATGAEERVKISTKYNAIDEEINNFKDANVE